MGQVSLAALEKRFGPTPAVDGVSLEIADGEFVAFLGPSGCGKTTLLRLIAGFEHADAGRIVLAGREVSGPGRHVPPEERRVGIVFQSYALWPHLDVGGNVGYALDVAGIKGQAHAERVSSALATVGLAGYEKRRPAELSGGQRQRVALARCLAMEAAVVLLDEPLANLDVHLRASMIDEFSAFHQKTGATMVYITHDQGEAMALADRIAVMDRGKVAQVASPRALYREPATAMVGGFIGRGSIVTGRVIQFAGVDGAGTRAQVELCGQTVLLRCAHETKPGAAQICLRPEDLGLASPEAAGAIVARVTRTIYRGGKCELDLAAEADPNVLFRLDARDDRAPKLGDKIGVAVSDGWVIPQR
jgi:iron(III) transport system ATP-binding protein